jgi:hypothetical protein
MQTTENHVKLNNQERFKTWERDTVSPNQRMNKKATLIAEK